MVFYAGYAYIIRKSYIWYTKIALNVYQIGLHWCQNKSPASDTSHTENLTEKSQILAMHGNISFED